MVSQTGKLSQLDGFTVFSSVITASPTKFVGSILIKNAMQ